MTIKQPLRTSQHQPSNNYIDNESQKSPSVEVFVFLYTTIFIALVLWYDETVNHALFAIWELK